MHMAAAAVLAVAAGGCIGTTSRDHFEQIINDRGGGFTSELATDAVDAVAERLGVDDFRIRHMSLYPPGEQVVMEVRDPQVPGNLDTYTVRKGKIDEVEPVRLSSSDDLGRDTFPVSSLALDQVEEMVDAALADFDARNGYATSMSVGLQGEGKPVFSLSMESERASATAELTAAGELIEVTSS
jgi:hypothetical protein